jgi:hypothetical protein
MEEENINLMMEVNIWETGSMEICKSSIFSTFLIFKISLNFVSGALL